MDEVGRLKKPDDETFVNENAGTSKIDQTDRMDSVQKISSDSGSDIDRDSHSNQYCYVPKNPKKLMDTYTVRPSRGQPMTWRHELEPSEQKFAIQDYTKTPIPRVSRRLMARQCEGLLMRRLERIMHSPYGPEYNTALKLLTIKTWDPTFNITLYPPVMEGLLNCYARIKEHLDLQNYRNYSDSIPLFNDEKDDEDNDLSCLTRVAAIFRNLSHAVYNQNILSTHPGIVSVICEMISLEYTLDFGESISGVTDGSNQQKYTVNNEDLNDSYRFTIAEIGNRHRVDYLKHRLREIRFSLLEVLSIIAHTLMLGSAVDTTDTSGATFIGDSNSSIMNKLSEFGKHVAGCLPHLIDIVLSPTENAQTVFLIVEILAKLALNSNSRPLWLSIGCEKVVDLVLKLLQYALKDDQLSEWAIFAAYHISLNGVNLPMAQALCKKDVIEYLIPLCNAQHWSPSPLPENPNYAAITYRRYSMAFKAVSILQKFVSFVPIRHILAKHESTLVNIFSSSSEEIAKPLKYILVQY